MEPALLSIDTAYDENLSWFEEGRLRLYEDITAAHNVIPLGVNDANRHTMLEHLGDEAHQEYEYHGVVISTHGRPGQVKASKDSLLFSTDDTKETLKTIAKGRLIYICACETMRGPLPTRLLNAGATMVAGFTDSPEWTCTEGALFWRDVDLDFVRCAVYKQGAKAFRRAKQQALERIETTLPHARGKYRNDLRGASSVLKSMVIREKIKKKGTAS